MSAQTTDTSYVPLPGGDEAVYRGGALADYGHADWQGSIRLASTPGRGLADHEAYAAFGQSYESGLGNWQDFTGQQADITSPNYSFPMRDYSPIQGRWWTPDPAGLAAVNPANPQTWNAYAYVAGQPLTSTDPLGLCSMGSDGRMHDDANGPCQNIPEVTVNGDGVDADVFEIYCFEVGGCNTPGMPGYNYVYVGPGAPGAGGGAQGPPAPNPTGPPQIPNRISTCTATQQSAAALASAFESASKTSGWLAFGSGVGTAISGAGEGVTLGVDTPVTVSFGTASDFFGTASLVTGMFGAGLNAFAAGNTRALSSFDWNHLAGIASAAAASRIPGLAPWAETIGHLAEQGAELANRAGEVCN